MVATKARVKPPPAPPKDRSERNWFFVLLVGLFAAFPLLLYWGRDQWFFLDEWALLVNRGLDDPSSLLESHNGHWISPLALEYLVNQRVFGLDSYLPYQAPAVISHLGVVAMTWLVMRRMAVRPAVATLTALPLAFYGAGAMNIVFGFQVSLTVSVFCGLAQMLLADHDGPVDRRDGFAIVFGVIAIASSAVGPPMIVGVAVATLLRRGWRAAALQTAPLACIYLAWYAVFGRDVENQSFRIGGNTVPFVAEMARAAFSGMGRQPIVSSALALIALLGAFEVWRRWRTTRELAPVAVPAGLLAAFLAFAGLTALTRAQIFGAESGGEERYIYIAAALFIPFVGLGGEVLARRWIGLAVVPLALLLVGIPANVDQIRNRPPASLGARDPVAAVAFSPLLNQLAPNERVFSSPFSPELAPTADWLRTVRDDGSLSELGNPTEQELLNAEAAIAFAQRGEPQERPCNPWPLGPVLSTTVNRGDRLVFSGTIWLTVLDQGKTSVPARYEELYGGQILVRAGPVQVQVGGPDGGPPALCRLIRAGT